MPSPRKPVPLGPVDLQWLTDIRTEGTWQHATVVDIFGGDAVTSDASALQALVRLGIERLREHSLEQGYAAVAASRDAEDAAYEEAMRGRARGGRS